MRERVAELGGTVVARPEAGGGFRLHVSIPIDGRT
jgi:signal transduction histidine kinase